MWENNSTTFTALFCGTKPFLRIFSTFFLSSLPSFGFSTSVPFSAKPGMRDESEAGCEFPFFAFDFPEPLLAAAALVSALVALCLSCISLRSARVSFFFVSFLEGSASSSLSRIGRDSAVSFCSSPFPFVLVVVPDVSSRVVSTFSCSFATDSSSGFSSLSSSPKVSGRSGECILPDMALAIIEPDGCILFSRTYTTVSATPAATVDWVRLDASEGVSSNAGPAVSDAWDSFATSSSLSFSA
mmetsp:Transcript_3163/g.19509  ORF Transcript_3163/g.19509 Transcript_3163/m.19509 type:complete len:242 (-) Transcript_3163:229-954(-)